MIIYLDFKGQYPILTNNIFDFFCQNLKIYYFLSLKLIKHYYILFILYLKYYEWFKLFVSIILISFIN